MAIDTATKRRNTFRFPNVVLPASDGSVDAADRAHLCWVYGGLTWQPAVLDAYHATAAFVTWRDKRAAVVFREKYANIMVRDKRGAV